MNAVQTLKHRRKNMRIYALCWRKTGNETHLRLAAWFRDVSRGLSPDAPAILPLAIHGKR